LADEYQGLPESDSVAPYQPPVVSYSWPPRVRFQHRYRWHVILFLATLVTTTLTQRTLAEGLWYSIPLLLILGAHEFGHYTFCRFHNVDATLPYFLPGIPGLLLTGTFGAVIRIREPFPNKRALFDIGVAGPIAGFLMMLPLLFWGIHLSHVIAIPAEPSLGEPLRISLGEPLLIKLAIWMHFGVVPPGRDVELSPMGLAAWWGMFVTALNLLPFGQLDGGHIAYSVIGRRAGIVSAVTLGAAVLLTVLSRSWIAMAVLMSVMAWALGLHHPRVLDESTLLDRPRRLVAIFALVMFVVCFTPVPIEFIFGR